MTIPFLRRASCQHAKYGKVLLLALTFAFFCCLPARSQSLGRISGIVKDAKGSPVSGATVTVTDVARRMRRVVTTNGAGAYTVPGLIPGTYSVDVVRAGTQGFDRDNVRLEIAGDVHVDAILQPGQRTQTVAVTSVTPALNTANAQLSSSISPDTLNELPLAGHNYIQLLAFLPTLQLRQGSSAGPSENSDGQRAASNLYVLDGVAGQQSYYTTSAVNSAFSAAAPEQAVLLPIDSIQEFNVLQNAKADAGWRPGAQINLAIKSGTDSYHGAASALGSFTALNGEDFFAAAKPSVSFADFEGAIGGPIVKGRLFAFLGYEGQRDTISQTTNSDVPSLVSGLGIASSIPDVISAAGTKADLVMVALSGCTLGPPLICAPGQGVFNNDIASDIFPNSFPASVKTDDGVARVDLRLTQHNIFSGEFFGGDGFSILPLAATEPYWSTLLEVHSRVGRASWTWTPNSTWVNQLRFGLDNAVVSSSGNYDCTSSPGVYEGIDDRVWISGSNAPDYQTISGFVGGGQPGCALPAIQINGFTQSANGVSTSNLLGGAKGTLDNSEVDRLLDSASWTHGKHIVEFGGEFMVARGMVSPNADLSKGTLIFNNLTDFVEGTPNFYELETGTVPRQFIYGAGAAFVQDDWRIFPRLTLNVGLRYEYTRTLTERGYQFGNVDFSNPYGMIQQGQGGPLYRLDPWAFAPRIGVAYDVTGKGTTVVRAGGNVVYQNPPVQAFFDAGMNAVPTAQNLSNGATLFNEDGTINLVNINTPTPIPSGETIKTGVAFFGGTLALPSGCSPVAPCGVGGSPATIQMPMILNWNLGVQHAVNNNLSVDVEYVGTHGQHLFELADVNQPAPGSIAGEQQRRPLTRYPWFGQVTLLQALPAWSNYNGLQVIVRERVTHGLTFLATYTYSHALDTASSELELPQNSFAPAAAEYGNSSFDLRHHLALGPSYLIPGKPGHWQMLQGWQVSSVASVFSGRPFGATDTGDDTSGTGDLQDRWTLVGNARNFTNFGTTRGIPCYDANITGVTSGTWTSACTSAAASPAVWQACVSAANAEPSGPAGVPNRTGIAQLDRLGCYAMGGSVIVPPAQGTFGTMSRNELYSVGAWEWDASIVKTWGVRQGLSAQFRVDLFNVTNTTFFAAPPSSLQSPANFGLAAATPAATSPFVATGGPRKIQLGLKLLF